MAFRKFAIFTALALTFPGSAAFAQELNQPRTGFYADPALPDPVPYAGPVTEVPVNVAAATPVPHKQAAAACTARNPCSAAAPAARG